MYFAEICNEQEKEEDLDMSEDVAQKKLEEEELSPSGPNNLPILTPEDYKEPHKEKPSHK